MPTRNINNQELDWHKKQVSFSSSLNNFQNYIRTTRDIRKSSKLYQRIRIEKKK